MRDTSIDNTVNIPRILRTIWLNKGISRIEIAKMLNIDKSTVTNIVNKLINLGIVRSIAEGQSSPVGGRKPIHLAIKKDFGSILGFEIQPDSYKAVITNLDGEIIDSKIGEFSISKDNFISEITKVIKNISKKIQLPLIGIGIGLPGMVNSDTGIIYKSILLDIFEDFNFYEEMNNNIDIPIFIENDANCCAWGELSIHKDENLKNFIFILIEFRETDLIKKDLGGIAVGLGIVLDGKVYYGSNYSAGEFRSIFTVPFGFNQFSLTKEETVNIKKDKNIFLKFIKELSKNIALIVNTFGISHLFYAGTKTDFQDEITPIFIQTIKDNWSYKDQINCIIKESTMHDMAVAYGACGMILERVFSIPSTSISTDQNQIGRNNIINNIQSIIKMNKS
jgi:hypothetical protein